MLDENIYILLQFVCSYHGSVLHNREPKPMMTNRKCEDYVYIKWEYWNGYLLVAKVFVGCQSDESLTSPVTSNRIFNVHEFTDAVLFMYVEYCFLVTNYYY